jgi:hypothetical protein
VFDHDNLSDSESLAATVQAVLLSSVPWQQGTDAFSDIVLRYALCAMRYAIAGLVNQTSLLRPSCQPKVWIDIHLTLFHFNYSIIPLLRTSFNELLNFRLYFSLCSLRHATSYPVDLLILKILVQTMKPDDYELSNK